MENQDSLKDRWQEEALRWAAWARKPGHDSYWQFHREQFFELIPPAGHLTVDVGCGEGRVTRDLQARGHRVVGVDGSPTLIELAREADPAGTYHVADAASLPLADGCADLVVAFMALHDVENLDAAACEIHRILTRWGMACVAIVHPLNSVGRFSSEEDNSPYVIEGSYLESFRYAFEADREGMKMTFHSLHRPLESFSRAFEKAGLLIQAVREHPVPASAQLQGTASRWQRLPLFCHFRLVKIDA